MLLTKGREDFNTRRLFPQPMVRQIERAQRILVASQRLKIVWKFPSSVGEFPHTDVWSSIERVQTPKGEHRIDRA
jgi:hypothetical protein